MGGKDTKFKKGKKKTGGRKKGVQNKNTLTMKETIKTAFEELGGIEYLVDIGKDDPRTFISLLSKLIPAEIAAEIHHTGTLTLTEILGSIDDPGINEDGKGKAESD